MAYKSVHIIMNGDSGVRCNADGTITGLTKIPPIFAGDKYIFELEVIDDAQAAYVLDGDNATFVLTVKSRKSSEDILAASASFDDSLWGDATANGSNGKVSTYLDFNTTLFTDFMKGQSEKDVYFELAERYTADDTQRTIAQWELEATGDMYNNDDLTGTTPVISLLREITQTAIQNAIIAPFTIARGFIANAGANLWALTANGSDAVGQSYGLKIKAGTNASDAALLITSEDSATEFFKIDGNGVITGDGSNMDLYYENIDLYDSSDVLQYQIAYNETDDCLDFIDVTDSNNVVARIQDGKVLFGDDTASGAYNPRLLLTPDSSQYGLTINAGQYGLYAKTSTTSATDFAIRVVDSTDAETFAVDASGKTTIKEADITGDLAIGGTVDGRDVAADGTKLDDIEAEAKDDQLASEVPFTADGDISSTDVQAAIQEVRDDTDTKLSSKSATGHSHSASDVSDFDTEVGNNTTVAANTLKLASLDIDAQWTESGGNVSRATGDVDIEAGGLTVKKAGGDVLAIETTGDITSNDPIFQRFKDTNGTQGLIGFAGAGTRFDITNAAGGNIFLETTGDVIIANDLSVNGVDITPEEGTFTPTVQDTSFSDAESQTYSFQDGEYQKIGNWVHFKLRIGLSSLGSLASGSAVYIAGLPFSSASGSYSQPSVYCGYAGGLSITAGVAVSGYIDSGTSRLVLQKWSATTGTATLLVSDTTAAAQFMISGSYKV